MSTIATPKVRSDADPPPAERREAQARPGAARSPSVVLWYKQAEKRKEKLRVTRLRQRAIGDALIQMYDCVVREEIPRDMLALLDLLDDKADAGGNQG